MSFESKHVRLKKWSLGVNPARSDSFDPYMLLSGWILLWVFRSRGRHTGALDIGQMSNMFRPSRPVVSYPSSSFVLSSVRPVGRRLSVNPLSVRPVVSRRVPSSPSSSSVRPSRRLSRRRRPSSVRPSVLVRPVVITLALSIRSVVRLTKNCMISMNNIVFEKVGSVNKMDLLRFEFGYF